MNPITTIAVRAARSAGNVIMRHLENVESIQFSNKDKNDFVSQVDLEAEAVIIETLRKAYPDYGFLAEESGLQEGKSDYQWIIDPLDGTTNFRHGFPQFSVSIALAKNGQLINGVVYDPVRQELFTAAKGEGAYLDNRRIRVSKQRGLDEALLGTGFPFADMDYVDVYLATFKALMTKTAGIRRPGSAALDLAYVACGRIDGFWEMNLKPWDLAAGALLIKEAGGLVGDFGGGEQYLANGNIIAGNAKVFKELLQTIGPLLPPAWRK